MLGMMRIVGFCTGDSTCELEAEEFQTDITVDGHA